MLESLIERVGELFVALERLLDHPLVLIAQREQPLHVQHRVAIALLLLHQLGAAQLDVCSHDVSDHLQPWRRLRHPLEQLVHARQVLHEQNEA